MLADIRITDLGAIPDANAEFSPGLTVLTGETGAGKTMVVTGLRLLTGGRADAGRVRTGAERATVEGRFLLDDVAEVASRISETVQEAGGELDENGDLLVARQVSAKGRSKAHVGGRSVPAGTLAAATEPLLTLHGQNDQLRLLAAEQQLRALDEFGGTAVLKLAAHYRSIRGAWKTAATDLQQRTEKRMERAQRADQLRFAIEEINAIDPVAGEETELAATIRRLHDADALRTAAAGALAAIDGPGAVAGLVGGAGDADDEEAAAELLGTAAQELRGATDKELQGIGTRLDEVTTTLADISAELGSYLENLPADDVSVDELMNRQADLRTLTRKYAPDIAGVVQWREKAEAALAQLDDSTEALEQLRADVAKLEQQVAAAAKKLTAARTKAAKKLSTAVTSELAGLAMGHAALSVDVSALGKFGPDGQDNVAFALAEKDGTNPRPLSTSASGGELSRIMLALEVVLAAESHGGTLVFDEVDAGVGGRAAVEIGRRLARLALRHQVIVVTHLPQVAAYADHHLHVAKDVGQGPAASAVTTLAGEARVEELARMMAGLDESDSGRAHAAELLERAAADRAGWK